VCVEPAVSPVPIELRSLDSCAGDATSPHRPPHRHQSPTPPHSPDFPIGISSCSPPSRLGNKIGIGRLVSESYLFLELDHGKVAPKQPAEPLVHLSPASVPEYPNPRSWSPTRVAPPHSPSGISRRDRRGMGQIPN